MYIVYFYDILRLILPFVMMNDDIYLPLSQKYRTNIFCLEAASNIYGWDFVTLFYLFIFVGCVVARWEKGMKAFMFVGPGPPSEYLFMRQARPVSVVC